MNSMVKKNSVLFKTGFEDVRQAVIEATNFDSEDDREKFMSVTIATSLKGVPEVYFDFGNFKIKPL